MGSAHASLLSVKHDGVINTDTNFQGEEGFPNLFEIGDIFSLSITIDLNSLQDFGYSPDSTEVQYFRAYSDYRLNIQTGDADIFYEGPEELKVWLIQKPYATSFDDVYTLLYFDFASWNWEPKIQPIQMVRDSSERRSFTLNNNIVGHFDVKSDEWMQQTEYLDGASIFTIFADGQRSIQTEGTFEIFSVSTPLTFYLFGFGFAALITVRLYKKRR
jgi:hypothetical protein